MSDEDLQASPGLSEGAPASDENTAAPPETDAPATGTEQPAKDEPPAEPEKTEAEKQPWFMKRIHQQSAKIADLAREREALAHEKATLEARLAGFGEQQPGERPQGIPREEVERLADLRAREIAAQRSFDQACNSTFEAGTKEFPDFASAVETLKALGAMQQDKVQTILDAADTDAHKAIYALGKNPEEAERIFNLSPTRMAVELAKLAASAPGRQPPPISKAPDPITPIGGSARAEKDPDKMSTDEWMAWREKQLRKG